MSVTDANVVLFMENAAKVAAGLHQIAGTEELKGKLAEIVERDVDVFCPKQTELEKLAAGFLDRLIPGYREAWVTVEEVTAAIAETGSIVCTSANGKAVQASLIPSHHVALVPREKIFATLDDFFAVYGVSPSTNMTIITGPSRTADIELNLVIGVHGPERLDIIVI